MVSNKVTSQLIKEQNINNIYQVIRSEKAISRVEIAKKLKLSQTSVGRSVSDLLEAGYIRVGENIGNSVGRQRTLLHIVPTKVLSMGLFICNDRIDAGVVDISGNILNQKTFELQNTTVGYVVEEIKVIIDYLLSQVEDESLENLVGIGVSVPGTVNYKTGMIIEAPLLHWKSVNLGGILQACYPYNIVIDNSVKSFAKEQRFLNTASDPNEFLVIHLGADFSLAEMLGGKLIRGHNNMAGEIGHILIEPNGALCDCGRRGCLQTRVNKNYIEKELGKTFAEAVKGYYDGDESCFRVLNRVVNDISMWLANLMNIYDPGEIFLTGSMIDEWDELIDLVSKHFRRFLWSQFTDGVKITKPKLLGREGNVVAAASNIFYKFVIKDMKNYYDKMM